MRVRRVRLVGLQVLGGAPSPGSYKLPTLLPVLWLISERKLPRDVADWNRKERPHRYLPALASSCPQGCPVWGWPLAYQEAPAPRNYRDSRLCRGAWAEENYNNIK